MNYTFWPSYLLARSARVLIIVVDKRKDECVLFYVKTSAYVNQTVLS